MKKGTRKALEDCKLNNLDFLKFDTKEKVYTLGMLNADGYIQSRGLWLYLVKEDLENIQSILEKSLPFKFYERQLKNNRKPQKAAYISSTYLLEALDNLEFNNKSNKFIEYEINPKYLKYFLLGYFDGDGCFYFKKSKKGDQGFQFNVSARFDFDWSYLEFIFKELNIEYRKVCYQYKNSGFSRLVVSRKTELKKLIEFLYDGEEIGLHRKKEKALQILNYVNNSKQNIAIS